MKKIIKLSLICANLMLFFALKSFAYTHNVSNTNELKSPSPAYTNGDTINIINSFSSDADIDDIGVFTLNIQGNNKTIDGNTHYGFITNPGSNYTINNLTLQNFKADYASAFFNYDSDLTLNNVTFKDNTAINSGWGGAIYNWDGDVLINNSSFINNTVSAANAYGGAIVQYSGNMTITNTLFSANQSQYQGGSIYTAAGSNLIISNCLFDGKYPEENILSARYGGAIYSRGNLKVYNTEFKNIQTYLNGTIYNYRGEILLDGVNFHNNFIFGDAGGALANNSGPCTVRNSIFYANYSRTKAGALMNGNYTPIPSTTMNIYNSAFNMNSAKYGGALYNNDSGAFMNVYDSRLTNNSATYGGVLGNFVGTTSFENCTITGNDASSNGGAIYNFGTGIVNIKNSTLSNNSADVSGGAVYSVNGTINVIADAGNTIFSGNKANGISNAIHIEDGTLNLDSYNNGHIIFNDKITTSNISRPININQTSATSGGTIELNETLTPATITLYGGTLKLGADQNINNNILTLSGGTINMINKATGVANLNTLNLATATTTNIGIDISLINQSTDRIIASTVGAGTGLLNISAISLINDNGGSSSSIAFADSSIKDSVLLGTNEAFSPINKFNISYASSSGNLTLTRDTTNFNPAILSSSTSAVAGSYTNQTNAFSQAFNNADSFMLMPRYERDVMLNSNKYAYAGDDMVFSPLFSKNDTKGLWVKQYTTFERVPLVNGPNIASTGYGAIIGGDSDVYKLKHGYDGIITAYIGYNGSHQTYENVGTYQNGALAGLTGTVYKGNLFSALTANVGTNFGESNTMYGNENFTTLMAGLASKTGYNFEFLRGKLILQPSFLMSYSFINTFDYTNAAGVDITSEPMNAIQLAPSIKLIGNTRSGWQPYIGFSTIWNIMDTAKFYANEVALPNMSIAPYCEYALGLQRRWKERLTGFGQITTRSGGRVGIGFLFGFRWAI